MFLKTCFTAYCLYNCGICYTFVRLFAEKKVCGIFGGIRKSVYLCNRKRETNAPHTEASVEILEANKERVL